MSKVVRSIKNVTKGFTTPQIKVRNATSNDPWGPVGSDMAEIAQLTFADTGTFYEIMDILDKRLNDKGKNWRHVLKALKVLDYCLHEGSELVVTWARKNIYVIKTLREFQHIDEEGRDVGQNIRVSAKELTALIMDEERLRAERSDRKSWKSRVTGLDDSNSPPHDAPRRRTRALEDDDEELRRAIEASRSEAEQDEAKRRREAGKTEEVDADLAKALKLSKEEEDLRRRELEEANANSLFDDGPAQPAVAQPTGWNQGYQQQPSVDWFGNVIDPQQQQNTGFGMQPQMTGYQNGNGYGFQQQQQQQPQQTGFPYGQQPQQNFMQPQQTAFNNNGNNPYGQQNGFGQQPQQQDGLQAGSNNPWAQNHSADSLKPQPTGSNNPFASGFNRPQSAQTNRLPTLGSLSEQKATTSFNPIQNYQAPQPVQQPVQQQQQQPLSIPQDPHKARLNALLSSGEGQDTFGNVGDLRIPAQHTAPGTFINSAGAGGGKLTANATGNPFMQSQQFTGMPQTTGFGQNQMMPAQTGPAGAFGASYGQQSNPFGGHNGQQRQHQQQGGSLIDL
ncbi:ENTH-domain-containing protein [Tothia fuscella]|uniref:ENTH-domain-containing protein n=1 Tax=Tothia fuscella TaxID=1048955 RepID=A0A9P4NZL3_9PEZI|nr:ENTH-domain-containing protein [Tothia fuscella]